MRRATHAQTHRNESRKDGSTIHQATYRLDPPLELTPHHLEGKAELVIVSTSLDPRHEIDETIISPTNEARGNRIGIEILRTPATSHQAALERLGYSLG